MYWSIRLGRIMYSQIKIGGWVSSIFVGYNDLDLAYKIFIGARKVEGGCFMSYVTQNKLFHLGEASL